MPAYQGSPLWMTSLPLQSFVSEASGSKIRATQPAYGMWRSDGELHQTLPPPWTTPLVHYSAGQKKKNSEKSCAVGGKSPTTQALKTCEAASSCVFFFSLHLHLKTKKISVFGLSSLTFTFFSIPIHPILHNGQVHQGHQEGCGR